MFMISGVWGCFKRWEAGRLGSWDARTLESQEAGRRARRPVLDSGTAATAAFHPERAQNLQPVRLVREGVLGRARLAGGASRPEGPVSPTL